MHPTPFRVTRATPENRKQLVELFLNLLEYLEPFGHDTPPYRENAEWFVDQVFLPAAARQEPVLLAWEGQTAVGALFWVIPQQVPPIWHKQAVGYGTYVDPDYRKHRVGNQLWAKGLAMLQKQGVKSLIGTVYEDNKDAMKFIAGKSVDKDIRLVRINVGTLLAAP